MVMASSNESMPGLFGNVQVGAKRRFPAAQPGQDGSGDGVDDGVVAVPFGLLGAVSSFWENSLWRARFTLLQKAQQVASRCRWS
jgi:hypothetical protein